MNNVSCIFCKSKDIIPAVFPQPTHFNGKEFTYKNCRACGLIFIDPIPNEQDLQAMYPIGYHEAFYFHETPADYGFLYNKLKPVLQNGTLLDYGCGDGSFLQYMSGKGFKSIGTEYNPVLVTKLREQYPDSEFNTIDDFWKNTQQQYDVIHLGDVLEHITTPLDLLTRLKARLKPGGILLVHGPLENNTSLGLTVRKGLSRIMSAVSKRKITHTPYHIIFSARANQKAVFEHTGYASLVYDIYETPWPYPSSWSWKPGMAIKYLIGQVSVGTSKLSGNKLGNRFVYIGQKAA